MKKAFYLVAIATLALVSCQKEIDINEQTPAENHGLTFKASIEALSDPATKAAINASNQLVWAENDQIGIYVNDGSWTDKNQPFTLVGTGGTTTGEFAWDYGTFDNPNATAAFFPWNGTGSSVNNVYEGTMYFKLPESYWSYTSGKMLTPLVAKLEGSTGNISFKHAGAAVKVTINNLPAHVHSIGMSVEAQQITGSFHISPQDAGVAAMALDAAADISKNTVWLNVWNGSESEWSFIFPVPELDRPKLSFQIWDENDVLVWSKKLKAQSSYLNRGDLLEMPAIDITPYSKFTESTEWTVTGQIGGNDYWGVVDFPMYTDGTVCILSGINFAAGDAFKVRKDKDYVEAYPGSNYEVTAAGKYDVIFNIDTKEVTLKEAKCPYPAPKVKLCFGINTSNIPKGVAFDSNTLGASPWPGIEMTEKEMINGKWYYKYEVPGTAVWGKTITDMYVVGIDQWNTSKSSGDFTTISNEYWFEATSGQTLEQLTGRPADIVNAHTAITIDGSLDEWASVDGTTNGNNTLKVESDDDFIYIYSLRTTSGRYSEIWNGTGYVYVGLDLDGNEENGEILNGNAPYDYVGFFFPYKAPYEVGIYGWGDCLPSTASILNIACMGVGDETAGAEFEMRIPRTDMPSITSSVIKVTTWGNKDMSKASIYHTL